MKVYFYWFCHWDIEKVMAALGRHYAIPYDADDSKTVEAIVTRAYREYHGIRGDFTTDVHASTIRQCIAEMHRKNIVPECIQREVYGHACVEKTPGFDLVDLIGEPPYKCNWESPRPVAVGALMEVGSVA